MPTGSTPSSRAVTRSTAIATGGSRVINRTLRHKYSLLLTATCARRRHRSVIGGVGGGPSHSPPSFATMQNNDATLSFVMRDIDGNPVGAPWTVPPQQ